MHTYSKGFIEAPVSFEKYLQVVYTYLEEVNSSFTLMLALRLKYNGWDDLLEVDVNPGLYLRPEDFLDCQQALALFSKAPFLPLNVDTQLVATRKFLEAELACKSANERILGGEGKTPVMHSILHSASRKISQILGDVPTFESLSFEFGPGATYSIGGFDTTSFRKLTSVPETTPQSIEAAVDLLTSCPSYSAYHGLWEFLPSTISENAVEYEDFSLVRGSRLSFVPKSAKTDRAICIEPNLNAVMQKGVGSYIRTCLEKAGNRLNDGQQRHAELARQASTTGELATIDLASASDTISQGIVLDLLPLPWYELLDELRSHYYEAEEKWYRFHKFSSMGNGFTFELETLLFLALARATCQELGIPSSKVSVYGDDIIIPVAAVDIFTDVLNYCGFKLNSDKSFSSGPFRESCGSDWFLGKDVRPAFIRGALVPRTFVLFLNTLTRKGLRSRYPKTWHAAMRAIPGQYRSFVGPDDGTDGHIILPDYELMRKGRYGRGYKTFIFRAKTFKPKVTTGHDYLTYALYEVQFLSDQNTGCFNLLDPLPSSSDDEFVGDVRVVDEYGNLDFRSMYAVNVKRKKWSPWGYTLVA